MMPAQRGSHKGTRLQRLRVHGEHRHERVHARRAQRGVGQVQLPERRRRQRQQPREADRGGGAAAQVPEISRAEVATGVHVRGEGGGLRGGRQRSQEVQGAARV